MSTPISIPFSHPESSIIFRPNFGPVLHSRVLKTNLDEIKGWSGIGSSLPLSSMAKVLKVVRFYKLSELHIGYIVDALATLYQIWPEKYNDSLQTAIKNLDPLVDETEYIAQYTSVLYDTAPYSWEEVEEFVRLTLYIARELEKYACCHPSNS